MKPFTPHPSAEGSLVGSHIKSASAYAHKASDVQAWLRGKAEPPRKLVFLTFDDGPNHVTTPRILETMKKEGVHATFFVVGSMVKNEPDLLKREIAEGHAVNLHSYSHNYKRLYPRRVGNTKAITAEYDQALAAVREILGPGFFAEGWRYPGGHVSWKGLAGADQALLERGSHWIDWNADSGDSFPKSRRPTTVAQMVKNSTEPIRQNSDIAVVLAHDTPDKKLTADSLAQVIKAYKAAGYEFGIIS